MPYVIYLDSEVDKPVWRSDVGIQLSGNAGSITCGGWRLVANFTAGKSMEGLYGVVNSEEVNRIMLGGSGATLNAFSAWFEKVEAMEGTKSPLPLNSLSDSSEVLILQCR